MSEAISSSPKLPNQLRFLEMVRIGEWWTYKIAPLMGTAYMVASVFGVSFEALWPALLTLLLLLLPGAIYVSVLNDVTDQEEDLRCGKANRMANRSPLFQWGIVIACLLFGAAVSLLIIKLPWTRLLYATNWLVFTMYSVRPLRLKARRFWGVLMDACGSHLLPTLWTSTFLIESRNREFLSGFLICIGLWAFALGLRGILWHQLLDRNNDLQVGITTFATGVSPQLIKKWVEWFVFPIEVLAFGFLLIQISVWWAWLFVALSLWMEWQRNRQFGVDIVIVAPTPKHRLLLAEYYELFYPLTFLLVLTTRNPLFWVLLLLHSLLFHERLLQFCAHGFQIARANGGSALKRGIQARLRRNTGEVEER